MLKALSEVSDKSFWWVYRPNSRVRTIAAVGPNWFACLIRIWGHVKLLNIRRGNV